MALSGIRWKGRSWKGRSHRPTEVPAMWSRACPAARPLRPPKGPFPNNPEAPET